jgi:hypothetical protein
VVDAVLRVVDDEIVPNNAPTVLFSICCCEHERKKTLPPHKHKRKGKTLLEPLSIDITHRQFHHDAI